MLNDVTFWGEIEGVAIMDRSEEQDKLTEVITIKVEAVATSQNVPITGNEKAQIVRAMMPLCSNISLWFGGGAEDQVYQMNIAESPHAVTGKEFDQFMIAWAHQPEPTTANKWLAEHSQKVERSMSDIFHEMLVRALDRYAKLLRQAESVRREEDRPAFLDQARSLISILEFLVLDLANIDNEDKLILSNDVEVVFEGFATILKSSTPVISEFCNRNEAVLQAIIQRWRGDVTPC